MHSTIFFFFPEHVSYLHSFRYIWLPRSFQQLNTHFGIVAKHTARIIHIVSNLTNFSGSMNDNTNIVYDINAIFPFSSIKFPTSRDNNIILFLLLFPIIFWQWRFKKTRPNLLKEFAEYLIDNIFGSGEFLLLLYEV